MFEVRAVWNRRDTWCIPSPVQPFPPCLAALLTQVHLGTLQELQFGSWEHTPGRSVLEQGPGTAVQRVRSTPRALPPAQIALAPTSSDENLSWAGPGGAEASLTL